MFCDDQAIWKNISELAAKGADILMGRQENCNERDERR